MYHTTSYTHKHARARSSLCLPRSSFCQRYSAPQSPISVIIFRPFERSRTASISARSVSERRNLNTFRLSSGCSETPRRVPFGESEWRSPHGFRIKAKGEKKKKKKKVRRRSKQKQAINDLRLETKRDQNGLTYRQARRQRTGGRVPIARLYSRCSRRRGGRRLCVIR